MITKSIYKHDLITGRKLQKVIQIEFLLCIGLFGLIGSDQKPTEPNEISLVGFRFQPSYKLKRISIQTNFQNGFHLVGLAG